MRALPQMRFGNSPHHRLNVLSFAYPQTQVHCQRLSAQTVQRHRLANRFDNRPQIVNTHSYSKKRVYVDLTEGNVLKKMYTTRQDKIKTEQRAGTFEQRRRWATFQFVQRFPAILLWLLCVCDDDDNKVSCDYKMIKQRIDA